MKVILTEGNFKFGMNDQQTRYYITNGGEQVADFTIGVNTYQLNEHAAFEDVQDKEALMKLIARAFTIFSAKFQTSDPKGSDPTY